MTGPHLLATPSLAASPADFVVPPANTATQIFQQFAPTPFQAGTPGYMLEASSPALTPDGGLTSGPYQATLTPSGQIQNLPVPPGYSNHQPGVLDSIGAGFSSLMSGGLTALVLIAAIVIVPKLLDKR